MKDNVMFEVDIEAWKGKCSKIIFLFNKDPYLTRIMAQNNCILRHKEFALHGRLQHDLHLFN